MVETYKWQTPESENDDVVMSSGVDLIDYHATITVTGDLGELVLIADHDHNSFKLSCLAGDGVAQEIRRRNHWCMDDEGFFYREQNEGVKFPWNSPNILDAIRDDVPHYQYAQREFDRILEEMGIQRIHDGVSCPIALASILKVQADVGNIREERSQLTQKLYRIEVELTELLSVGPAKALGGILKCGVEPVKVLGQQMVDRLHNLYQLAVFGGEPVFTGSFYKTSDELKRP